MSSKKTTPDEGLYSRVTRRIWKSADFLALSKPKPSARELWLRLLIAPEGERIPGLFEAHAGGLADAMQWPIAAFRRCWKEISDRDMAFADWSAGLVWIPNSLRHNFPQNPNHVLGWRLSWKELPRCELRDRAQVSMAEAFAQADIENPAKGLGWAAAFANVTANLPPQGQTPTKGGNLPPQGKGVIGGDNGEGDGKGEGDPPKPPPAPEPSALQSKAQDWLRLWEHSSAGRNEAASKYGNPADWPEAAPIWDTVLEVFGVEDKPRVASDERTLAVVRRWADGYPTEHLTAAIRGSKHADYIAERRDFQTVSTILKDGSRVDKFRALDDGAPAASGQRATDDVLDEEALRSALYDRRKLAKMLAEGRTEDAAQLEQAAKRRHGETLWARAATEAA